MVTLRKACPCVVYQNLLKRKEKTMKFNDLMNGKTWRSDRIIEANGHWSAYSKSWDYNESSVLTKLIQEAGRLCDSYASDLFIDWSSLCSRIEKAGYDYEGEVCLFGMREMGVDGNSFIEARLTENPHYPYRAIYRLEITVTEEDYECDYGIPAKEIRMKLKRMD